MHHCACPNRRRKKPFLDQSETKNSNFISNHEIWEQMRNKRHAVTGSEAYLYCPDEEIYGLRSPDLAHLPLAPKSTVTPSQKKTHTHTINSIKSRLELREHTNSFRFTIFRTKSQEITESGQLGCYPRRRIRAIAAATEALADRFGPKCHRRAQMTPPPATKREKKINE